MSMKDQGAREVAAPVKVSLPLATLALVVWAILAFGHGIGLGLAGDFFDWSRIPGALHPEGGDAGFARAEYVLILFFGGVALAVIGHVAWRLRGVERRRLVEAAVPWALWGVLLHLIWECFIVYATELVHFAQYALVGGLFALALERGKHLQLAFLITVGLGFADEIWQHYGLHVWWMDDQHHYMDWSDPLLNGLGACGGLLPFATLARLRGEELPSRFGLIERAFALVAVLLLPLLLLGPVATSRFLGHYRYYPFWDEHVNHKPVHWLTPAEGIPLCLGMLLILGLLLDSRHRRLSLGWLVVLGLLAGLAIQPEARHLGRQVHEQVASVRAPWTATAPTIDGALDEPVWGDAVRLGPFVDDRSGESGISGGVPLKQTYVRVLWDDQAIYFAFEVEDDDIWARRVEGDERYLEWDENVQIFIDDGGDEITYYQFVVTPLGVVFDTFNLMPTAPLDYNPWGRQLGLVGWDAPDLRTAVRVDGTLDVVSGWTNAPVQDRDRGYVMEVAISWESFRTTTTPGGNAIRKTLQPQHGERWRLGLYRIERPRPRTEAEAAGLILDGEAARRLLGVSPERFAEFLAHNRLRPTVANGGEYRRGDVEQLEAIERMENQAWTPTRLTFHKPERFGVIEFVRPSTGE